MFAKQSFIISPHNVPAKAMPKLTRMEREEVRFCQKLYIPLPQGIAKKIRREVPMKHKS